MKTVDSGTQPVLTIKEVIGQVHIKRCLLPVPKEGELISSAERVQELFNLLMQERSIGQFIFWGVRRERVVDYDFCEFSPDGHRDLGPLDARSFIAGQDGVAVVIDGKRRLASLYVGLIGLSAKSTSSGSQERDEFFRSRKLCLNLLSKARGSDGSYSFKFLTKAEAAARDPSSHWFETGIILNFTGKEEIERYLRNNGLEKQEAAKACLTRLHRVINEKRSVSYVVERDEEVGKVFMMFL